MSKQKIIVFLGPTASGKSALAVELARRLKGEIISADSRQVYKGLDIGTGKITKKEMRGVPHHLLDVIEPEKTFTVGMYKKLVEKAVAEILSRGKLPIICGGTGFYIEAIVDNVDYPEVPADKGLRMKLAEESVDELYVNLLKKDPVRAKTIDPKNKVRLIRALEIASAIGKVPLLEVKPPKYEFLQIGIKTEPEELKKKIAIRLFARISRGMIAEAKRLHAHGLPWKRMRELGLEYRFLADHLTDKLMKKEMIEKLNTAIWHYAKRQMTWFRRDVRIEWYQIEETGKIKKHIKQFLRT